MLDESFSVYRLIRLANQLDAFVDDRLGSLGIHAGQERVLAELWREDALSQPELAARLSTEVAILTEVLKRLERERLVQRKPDPEDRRVTRVYLTDDGRAAEPAVRDIYRETESTFLAGLTASERGRLNELLTRIQPR